MVTGVAIVGCGAVGRKRAAALNGIPLVVVHDLDPASAGALSVEHRGCRTAASWQDAVTASDVDLVIVATPHDMLAPIARAAIAAGKHVLVEKPGARSAREFEPVVAEARAANVILKVGFNHRFHPALAKAHELFRSGVIGPLMYIRARYGHGGRLGYETEWRADPARAGGGELLDQGVHLIDLARWFAGDFDEVSGHVGTFFWNMPVEDNAFMLLRQAQGVTASLHVSWTEWKNLFSFEIFGRLGKFQVDGLGGSYGPERLTWYRMLPEMGPPEMDTWEFKGPDLSWEAEFDEMFNAIAIGRPPLGSADDGLAALRIVDTLYARSPRAAMSAQTEPHQ